MTLDTSNSANARLYYLDWLRVLAFGLLVFYHAGLIFVDWGYHIQNNEFSSGLKLPMLFLNQWRLPLLFFVSGVGVRFALRRKTSAEFLKERVIRLFIPLLFGVLLIIPPQVYVERLYRGEFAGSYFSFYPEFFNGIYPNGNFTWNHLWFLVYLIVYIVIALPLFNYLRTESGKKIMSAFEKFFTKRVRLLLLFLPLVLVEVFLRERWPDTRNLISDWYNFIFYIIIFIYGYAIALTEFLWGRIEKDRFIYLITGLISFLIIYIGWHQPGEGFLEKSNPGYLIFQVLKCLNIISWILCFLGFGKRYLNFNNTVLQYTNKAVYPFYILHQTVLIIAGYFIIKLESGIFVKYALTLFATFLFTLMIYDLIILRIKWLRVFFGIK